MEFYNSEVEKSSREVPFLKDSLECQASDTVSFVKKAYIFAKGIMLFSSEYKASSWLGSESCNKLLALFAEISEGAEISTAIYMKPNPANRSKILVAFEDSELDKAKWSKIDDRTYIAAEILTKKKAKERIASSRSVQAPPS